MSHPYVEQAQVLEDLVRYADRWTEPETKRRWREEARELRRLAKMDEAGHWIPDKEEDR